MYCFGIATCAYLQAYRQCGGQAWLSLAPSLYLSVAEIPQVPVCLPSLPSLGEASFFLPDCLSSTCAKSPSFEIGLLIDMAYQSVVILFLYFKGNVKKCHPLKYLYFYQLFLLIPLFCNGRNNVQNSTIFTKQQIENFSEIVTTES